MAGPPTLHVQAKIREDLLARAREVAPAEVSNAAELLRYALAALVAGGQSVPRSEWAPNQRGPAKGHGGRPRGRHPLFEVPDTPEGIAS